MQILPSFVIVSLLMVLTARAYAHRPSRRLRYEVNPACELKDGTDCSLWTNQTLLHIRSDSSEDSIHFIWSFQASPSLLLARTLPETNLTVLWDKFLKGTPSSVEFQGPPPLYTFAYSLHKVWVFDDPKDDVRLDMVNQSTVVGYETKGFVWEREDNKSILNSSYVQLTFHSSQYEGRSLGPDGFFSLTVRARDTDGYSDILPYMLHNSNMSQIDLSFRNIQMNYPQSNPAHARVAFTFLLLQEEAEQAVESETTKMRLETVATLDDEHTPGVFNTINLRTPILGEYDQSFLQWKPICYFGTVRDITNSIDVTSYNIQSENVTMEDSSVEKSVLWSYYGTRLHSLVLQTTNVSFGSEKDGWYNKTPHISWTYMTGYGNPPDDYVSFIVILVMAVGLGIPLVIICGSVIYLIVKKLSKPKDDLLLGHPSV